MMTKNKVLVFLAIQFAIWWALSSWFWTRWYGWNLWSWFAPIAPIYLGCFYLQPRGVWQDGVLGVFASVALIGMVVASVRRRVWWLVLLAHLSLVFYWLVGFSLIATGV